MSKIIIYQLLPRLFSNTTNVNISDGDIATNGCGKFNEINDAALESIASMGFTHVWYTGIIRHASTTKYSFISHPSNANVVKGKAGSPYAICDYYDVDPDLAVDVDRRMDEWRELVERTHAHKLKVIIDFVPNHVARNYYSDSNSEAKQFGQDDDTTKAFAVNNNYYYIPNTTFVAPVDTNDTPYQEYPAKASGNDAFTERPSINDWYETVKLNYGKNYSNGETVEMPHPDTWNKMRDILKFWISTGIDCFRVDMAEMVPLAFWRWITLQITSRHSHIKFIAETYQSNCYKEYVEVGFNYLYDKSVFYNIVRSIIQRKASASLLTQVWQRTENVKRNMLYFLENHDEQRIASDYFASNPLFARPAYILALTMGYGSTMLYAGQEFGEKGMDVEGFSGRDGKTSIFDYWSVDTLSRNAYRHRYDNSKLTKKEIELKLWYATAQKATINNEALSNGHFYDLMWANQHIGVDTQHVFAYLRFLERNRFMIIVNFSNNNQTQYIKIPDDAWVNMGVSWNELIEPQDILNNVANVTPISVNAIKQKGLEINVPAHNGVVLRF